MPAFSRPPLLWTASMDRKLNIHLGESILSWLGYKFLFLLWWKVLGLRGKHATNLNEILLAWNLCVLLAGGSFHVAWHFSDENFTLFWFVCIPQESSQISPCETVPRGHFTLLTSPYFSCGCFLSFSFKLTQPSPPELPVRLQCYCTALRMPVWGWAAPFAVEHELNTPGHTFFIRKLTWVHLVQHLCLVTDEAEVPTPMTLVTRGHFASPSVCYTPACLSLSSQSRLLQSILHVHKWERALSKPHSSCHKISKASHCLKTTP